MGKKKKPPVVARTKKAFSDLGRDSVYVAEPISQLRICGGRGTLPSDEIGDLDTPLGPDVPVRDAQRLKRPLTDKFKAGVVKHGVKKPVIIAKIDDVATVIDGKSCVRAARAANRIRAKKGQPLLKLRCVMQRDVSQQAIMATLILTNNARTADDLSDRVQKLKAYLAPEIGGSMEDAAILFNVERSTLQDWLDFDDRATDETKRAVQDGTIAASTGLEIAKIKDPDAQRATLARVVAEPAPRQRSARKVRSIVRGEADRPTATDRRSQRLLYDHVAKTCDHARDDYWRGVLHALALVTAREDSVDFALQKALREARSAQEAAKAARAKAKATAQDDANTGDAAEAG